MNKEKLTDWLLTAAGLILLGVPVLGLVFIGTMRAADAYYKTGWMVAHWNDAESFPPGRNVCMHHFCTRTDTVLKHVGGRRGYTSEVQYYYCPVHESSFISTGGQFDGFLYFCYWIVAIICSAIPPLVLLIPMAFSESKFWLVKLLIWPSLILDVVAWVILIPMWVMFAWW